MQTTPTFPAFPTKDTTGITIRQHFAIECLKGLISNPHCQEPPERKALKAVAQADALIEALNKDG